MPKLLLVEDDEASREMLARRLRRIGYAVEIASDGREALVAAQTAPPDLILMDLTMPDLDGWEATRRLKSDPGTRGIPIIAVTARHEVQDVTRARLVGFDQYVTKPVDLRHLTRKMELLLPGK